MGDRGTNAHPPGAGGDQLTARRWRRLTQRARQVWGIYRWLVTTVAVIVAFALGFLGFGQARTADGTPLSVVDRVYDTLQLFHFSTAVPPPLSTELEVARWLALVTVAYAALAALRALFLQQWSEARVRFGAHNHVVVCGAGEMGTAVALDFRRRGLPVVVIDKDPGAFGTAQCRAAGIPVLDGDSTSDVVLLRARLPRARYLVATCGDDDLNVDIAVMARSLAGPGHGRLERCWAHIDDDRMCQLLETSALAESGEHGHNLDFFNLYRESPAAILDRFGAMVNSAPHPHLVVVGHGRLAVNLVLEAARRWRGRCQAAASDRAGAGQEPPLGRLAVTWVAEAAGALGQGLRAGEPALDGLVALRTLDVDAAESEVPALVGEADGVPAGASQACLVLVCLDNDAAALRAAIRVRHALAPAVPIVVSTSRNSGVARLLTQPELAPLDNVKAFDLEAEVSWVDFLLRDRTETLARAIHADYRRRAGPSAAPGSPAHLEWDDLPETYRRANRDQAADISRKLAAIGCRMVPTTALETPPFALSDEEVERLGELEHERWMSERQADGWVYGPVKDEAAKTHPAIVRWGQLSEAVKDLDRDTVRNIPAFLAGVGYAVLRKPEQAQTARAPY